MQDSSKAAELKLNKMKQFIEVLQNLQVYLGHLDSTRVVEFERKDQFIAASTFVNIKYVELS